MATCLSFLRVPDIARAISWYESIGFKCVSFNQEPGCEIDWALMEWEGARFMFYPEGRDDYRAKKDAGLYFDVSAIDSIIDVIKERAEVIEINPKTFYGKKEIVFKDLNGFQVTFGCEPD